MSDYEKVKFVLVLMVGSQITRLFPLLVNSQRVNRILSRNKETLGLLVTISVLLYMLKNLAFEMESLIIISSAVMTFLIQYLFGMLLISLLAGSLVYFFSIGIL